MKTVGVFCVVALLISATPAFANTKWDLPTGYPANNFHTENVQQFAADVGKATRGKVRITLHPAGSLFKANEIKRAVQDGRAQAGEIILSGYSNEDVLFATDAIPFLATSYSDARRLWEASSEAVEQRLAKQGLKILYTVPWPPQGIFSVKPIGGLEQIKKTKWRAYNPQTSRIAEIVGAQPATIPAVELPQALANGSVEVFMASAATGYDSKIWEQVKYYYDVRAWLPKNFVFVNQKAFDALSKIHQDAVLKAAMAAERRGWKTSEEKSNWYLEQLAKNGMTVEKPSPQLAAELAKVGETMIGEWAKQAGADGQKILNSYRK